jgi:hypothetical protein
MMCHPLFVTPIALHSLTRIANFGCTTSAWLLQLLRHQRHQRLLSQGDTLHPSLTNSDYQRRKKAPQGFYGSYGSYVTTGANTSYRHFKFNHI